MATVEEAAADMAAECAHERFVAAEALCRAMDRVVQLTPRGVPLGPEAARRAEIARQGVAAADRHYVRATVAVTASARLAESLRSSPGKHRL